MWYLNSFPTKKILFISNIKYVIWKYCKCQLPPFCTKVLIIHTAAEIQHFFIFINAMFLVNLHIQFFLNLFYPKTWDFFKYPCLKWSSLEINIPILYINILVLNIFPFNIKMFSFFQLWNYTSTVAWPSIISTSQIFPICSMVMHNEIWDNTYYKHHTFIMSI